MHGQHWGGNPQGLHRAYGLAEGSGSGEPPPVPSQAASRCPISPPSADSTEKPMIYLCPGAASAQDADGGGSQHSREDRDWGRLGEEKRGRKKQPGRERERRWERGEERREEGRKELQDCLYPDAPSRPHVPMSSLPTASFPITASSGPEQTQLLIINNSVYLYQNHYLNWLHDTYCSLSVPRGGGAIKARHCTPVIIPLWAINHYTGV